MIKYETNLGAKHLNVDARQIRDKMKVQLKGMHCGICKRDTIVTFVLDDFGYPEPKINACCDRFAKRIDSKLR